MKTKNKILYAALLPLLMLASCSKSFLDVTPSGTFYQANYYQTPDQAYSALIAAYNPLSWAYNTSLMQGSSYVDPRGPLNAGSDECYAGGGNSSDIMQWQAMNNYSILTDAVGPQDGFWEKCYTGIFRANVFLANCSQPIEGLSANTQARYIAEAKWLRAYYYFTLMRLFKNIPLITQPISSMDSMYLQPQASPDLVYAQIEKDLNDAIPSLPPTVAASENGRITQGAAQALLGKVILWEGGASNNARMLEAASWFDKVNTSANYALQANFGEIFDSQNKFNSESIFEITHTSANGQWSGVNVYGDVYSTMVGPRTFNGTIYFSGGWSFNPVMASFRNTMHNDPRYQYTILDADSMVAANSAVSYQAGYMNTGFFIKKYLPLAANVQAGVAELNFPTDYIEIRLADTYLMEAECLVRGGGDLTKAASLLNAVRARVGLPATAATLTNIYTEREFELATEGHRWYDLVRTGQAPTVLASKGFAAGKNELLPIPLESMNGTQMKQNPGY